MLEAKQRLYRSFLQTVKTFLIEIYPDHAQEDKLQGKGLELFRDLEQQVGSLLELRGYPPRLLLPRLDEATGLRPFADIHMAYVAIVRALGYTFPPTTILKDGSKVDYELISSRDKSFVSRWSVRLQASKRGVTIFEDYE